MNYKKKFLSETQLIQQYGVNKAFIVWAMGLYLDEQDLEDLANTNLTDNPDDHGIDFLRYDEDDGTLYIAQGYYTTKVIANAPAGKAADLNAACAWLVNGEIKKFHPDLQGSIETIRKKLLNDEISKVVLVYLHNCGESVEVSNELVTAKNHLQDLLKDHEVEVVAVQLGNESLERLYQNLAANIIVRDEVECPFPVKYTEIAEGWEWKAAVLTVSGQWLRDLYNRYSGDLFSANYRGFLGNYRMKINTGIKQTAERKPQYFWAFNNGITLLTTHIEERGGKTYLSGISIINGAQTTGSLGSIPQTVDLSNTQVLTRVIECSDPETINDIVKFNNTQNRITAWDSFSNDPIQIQLKEGFYELGHIYNLKRGFSNRSGILSIDTAIQPLLALYGKYKDANRSKSYLFESRTLYTEAFEHRGARNVLFACCLNTCLQRIKAEIKEKVVNGKASETERMFHDMFSVIKYKFYVLAIVAEVLHKLMPSLRETKRISFMPNQAKAAAYSYEALVDLIKPSIRFISIQICGCLGNDFYTKYNDSSSVETVASQVETNISSIKAASEEVQAMFDGLSGALCNG